MKKMKKIGIGLIVIGAGVVYTIFYGNGFIPKSKIVGIFDIIGLVITLIGTFLIFKSMPSQYICVKSFTYAPFKFTKGK